MSSASKLVLKMSTISSSSMAALRTCAIMSLLLRRLVKASFLTSILLLILEKILM